VSLADVPMCLKRLNAPDPLAVLAKLFALQVPVSRNEARQAFTELELLDWEELQIVERTSEGIRACVAISPFEDLLLAHDLHAAGGGPNPEHVLGPNAAAATLAHATPRRPVERALDIGTGCGIQALLLARHAIRVVATDLSARALDFAQFNAALNGLNQIEFRQGDLFGPVQGERFDLVVSNPPFVISPENRFRFRDGGKPADTLSAEVVSGIPQYLDEGGFGVVLCNWIKRDEPEPLARPRSWVTGTGCDCWILHSTEQDPLSYAALWNSGGDPQELSERLSLWENYYRELQIGSITFGALFLRKCQAPEHWIRTESLPETRVGKCGDQVLRLFANEDFIRELASDAVLLQSRFHLADDHEIEQILRCESGQWSIARIEIRARQGLRFCGRRDPATFQVVRACDGRAAIETVLPELEAQLGVPAARLASHLAEILRHLLRLGFLLPGDRIEHSVSPRSETPELLESSWAAKK
jgi:methylase of polypeptide subunit release factors